MVILERIEQSEANPQAKPKRKNRFAEIRARYEAMIDLKMQLKIENSRPRKEKGVSGIDFRRTLKRL